MKTQEFNSRKVEVGIAVGILIGLLIGLLISNKINNNTKTEYQTKIIFQDDVNETQRICINNMIKDIEPIFLKKVKSINFSNNDIEGCKNCQGLNLDGNLLIKISDFEFGVRSVICHEILHTLIENENYEEEIIDFLNLRWLPCYPELFKSSVEKDCSLKELK